MSLLDYLLLRDNRSPDLHVPSPSVCQLHTGLHHHVCWCWSMNVRMRLPAASSTLSTCVSSIPRTHRRFWRLSPSEHFPQHRPSISLGSIPPHLKASISSQAAQQSNRILPSSLHESHETAAVASHSGLIYLPPPPLLLRWLCRCNCPHLPSSSPSSALWSAPGKAGKLSLPAAKVSVGWAAGLPLSLWRMILWMKTEEMALGELLERLRTVIQTIGGWEQYIYNPFSLFLYVTSEDLAGRVIFGYTAWIFLMICIKYRQCQLQTGLFRILLYSTLIS